jgi:hypothetical protein
MFIHFFGISKNININIKKGVIYPNTFDHLFQVIKYLK